MVQDSMKASAGHATANGIYQKNSWQNNGVIYPDTGVHDLKSSDTRQCPAFGGHASFKHQTFPFFQNPVIPAI